MAKGFVEDKKTFYFFPILKELERNGVIIVGAFMPNDLLSRLA
jgi:hypothetical protein